MSSIHALNILSAETVARLTRPYAETVRELALAAKLLAELHVVVTSNGGSCDVCLFAWGEDGPEHAASCGVGNVFRLAEEVLSVKTADENRRDADIEYRVATERSQRDAFMLAGVPPALTRVLTHEQAAKERAASDPFLRIREAGHGG